MKTGEEPALEPLSNPHSPSLDISVIVPVWNDPERLSTCLKALTNQSVPREAYEIIVVDNGSTDETVSIAQSYDGVRVLTETQPGSYAARNRGLREALGRYIAFTDSDCIPDADWLAAMLRTARQNDAFGVLAGHVEFFKPRDDTSEAFLVFERLFLMRQDLNAPAGVCVTANWFAERDLLLSFGGFKAQLKSGGDFDLARRISSTGLAVHYVPDAVIRHPARANIADIIGKTRRITGGRWHAHTTNLRFLRAGHFYTILCLHRLFDIWMRSQPSHRVQVSGLVMLTWCASVYELIRLQLGFPALRR